MKKRLTRCLQKAVLIGILLGMSASAWAVMPVTTLPYYSMQQSTKLIAQLNQMEQQYQTLGRRLTALKKQCQALNASQIDHFSSPNRGGNHVN